MQGIVGSLEVDMLDGRVFFSGDSRIRLFNWHFSLGMWAYIGLPVRLILQRQGGCTSLRGGPPKNGLEDRLNSPCFWAFHVHD